MKNIKNDVLVLNRSFIPIQIVNWKKAIILIYKENARALDKNYNVYEYDKWILFSEENLNDYHSIKTIDKSIAIPEIIILVEYNKLPLKEVKYSRQSIFERDKFKCCYCNTKFRSDKLTIDHLMPKSRGGATTWDNVVTSCFKCNNRKGNMTPEEANMVMYLKPTKPNWFNPFSKVKTAIKYHSCESWDKFENKVI